MTSAGGIQCHLAVLRQLLESLDLPFAALPRVSREIRRSQFPDEEDDVSSDDEKNKKQLALTTPLAAQLSKSDYYDRNLINQLDEEDIIAGYGFTNNNFGLGQGGKNNNSRPNGGGRSSSTVINVNVWLDVFFPYLFDYDEIDDAADSEETANGWWPPQQQRSVVGPGGYGQREGMHSHSSDSNSSGWEIVGNNAGNSGFGSGPVSNVFLFDQGRFSGTNGGRPGPSGWSPGKIQNSRSRTTSSLSNLNSYDDPLSIGNTAMFSTYREYRELALQSKPANISKTKALKNAARAWLRDRRRKTRFRGSPIKLPDGLSYIPQPEPESEEEKSSSDGEGNSNSEDDSEKNSNSNSNSEDEGGNSNSEDEPQHVAEKNGKFEFSDTSDDTKSTTTNDTNSSRKSKKSTKSSKSNKSSKTNASTTTTTSSVRELRTGDLRSKHLLSTPAALQVAALATGEADADADLPNSDDDTAAIPGPPIDAEFLDHLRSEEKIEKDLGTLEKLLDMERDDGLLRYRYLGGDLMSIKEGEKTVEEEIEDDRKYFEEKNKERQRRYVEKWNAYNKFKEEESKKKEEEYRKKIEGESGKDSALERLEMDDEENSSSSSADSEDNTVAQLYQPLKSFKLPPLSSPGKVQSSCSQNLSSPTISPTSQGSVGFSSSVPLAKPNKRYKSGQPSISISSSREIPEPQVVPTIISPLMISEFSPLPPLPPQSGGGAIDSGIPGSPGSSTRTGKLKNDLDGIQSIVRSSEDLLKDSEVFVPAPLRPVEPEIINVYAPEILPPPEEVIDVNLEDPTNSINVANQVQPGPIRSKDSQISQSSASSPGTRIDPDSLFDEEEEGGNGELGASTENGLLLAAGEHDADAEISDYLQDTKPNSNNDLNFPREGIHLLAQAVSPDDSQAVSPDDYTVETRTKFKDGRSFEVAVLTKNKEGRHFVAEGRHFAANPSDISVLIPKETELIKEVPKPQPVTIPRKKSGGFCGCFGGGGAGKNKGDDLNADSAGGGTGGGKTIAGTTGGDEGGVGNLKSRGNATLLMTDSEEVGRRGSVDSLLEIGSNAGERKPVTLIGSEKIEHEIATILSQANRVLPKPKQKKDTYEKLLKLVWVSVLRLIISHSLNCCQLERSYAVPMRDGSITGAIREELARSEKVNKEKMEKKKEKLEQEIEIVRQTWLTKQNKINKDNLDVVRSKEKEEAHCRSSTNLNQKSPKEIAALERERAKLIINVKKELEKLKTKREKLEDKGKRTDELDDDIADCRTRLERLENPENYEVYKEQGIERPGHNLRNVDSIIIRMEAEEMGVSLNPNDVRNHGQHSPPNSGIRLSAGRPPSPGSPSAIKVERELQKKKILGELEIEIPTSGSPKISQIDHINAGSTPLYITPQTDRVGMLSKSLSLDSDLPNILPRASASLRTSNAVSDGKFTKTFTDTVDDVTITEVENDNGRNSESIDIRYSEAEARNTRNSGGTSRTSYSFDLTNGQDSSGDSSSSSNEEGYTIGALVMKKRSSSIDSDREINLLGGEPILMEKDEHDNRTENDLDDIALLGLMENSDSEIEVNLDNAGSDNENLYTSINPNTHSHMGHHVDRDSAATSENINPHDLRGNMGEHHRYSGNSANTPTPPGSGYQFDNLTSLNFHSLQAQVQTLDRIGIMTLDDNPADDRTIDKNTKKNKSRILRRRWSRHYRTLHKFPLGKTNLVSCLFAVLELVGAVGPKREELKEGKNKGEDSTSNPIGSEFYGARKMQEFVVQFLENVTDDIVIGANRGGNTSPRNKGKGTKTGVGHAAGEIDKNRKSSIASLSSNESEVLHGGDHDQRYSSKNFNIVMASNTMSMPSTGPGGGGDRRGSFNIDDWAPDDNVTEPDDDKKKKKRHPLFSVPLAAITVDKLKNGSIRFMPRFNARIANVVKKLEDLFPEIVTGVFRIKKRKSRGSNKISETASDKAAKAIIGRNKSSGCNVDDNDKKFEYITKTEPVSKIAHAGSQLNPLDEAYKTVVKCLKKQMLERRVCVTDASEFLEPGENPLEISMGDRTARTSVAFPTGELDFESIGGGDSTSSLSLDKNLNQKSNGRKSPGPGPTKKGDGKFNSGNPGNTVLATAVGRSGNNSPLSLQKIELGNNSLQFHSIKGGPGPGMDPNNSFSGPGSGDTGDSNEIKNSDIVAPSSSETLNEDSSLELGDNLIPGLGQAKLIENDLVYQLALLRSCQEGRRKKQFRVKIKGSMRPLKEANQGLNLFGMF